MYNQFNGIYAPYIKQYIDFKRGLGFKYRINATIFHIFDRFTIERDEKVVGVTKELAEAWRDLNPNESDSYKYHRCICLNQLSSYLCKIGFYSVILQLPPNKNTFVPYIFSKKQIAALFEACDHVVNKKKRMDSLIIILPALIRLLYGTGLRISEALALKLKNVNVSDDYVVVKDSKNGKERMIPISASLSTVLKEYLKYRSLLPIKSEYFFITLSGCRCSTDQAYRWFRKLLEKASISRNDHGPRLHDLRHTFSVHSLAMMAEAGIDLYCSLPTLSAYLGHQSLEATNAYVRLTAEMYPGLLKDIDLICLNVFPKNEYYATY